jgi:acetyltransferase-like isoleucine patch superfamily enzyme
MADFKRTIYFSPLGRIISIVQNIFSYLSKPFMVYGYKSKFDKKYYKNVRISSSAVILDPHKLEIEDNVWIWHHSIIDASNGVKIGTGCQIGAWVGIFSHSSHKAIRLYGNRYMEFDKSERIGYDRGEVSIGDYTFIGAGAIISHGVSIGKGCLIAAKSFVRNDISDFSIVAGNPAKVIGDVRKLDKEYLMKNNFLHEYYFDKDLLETILKEKTND